MSDEELADEYVKEEDFVCRYDMTKSDVDEIAKEAFLAGQRSKEKQLEEKIEKMKSLLKEVYEEFGFGELVKVRNDLPTEIQEIFGRDI